MLKKLILLIILFNQIKLSPINLTIENDSNRLVTIQLFIKIWFCYPKEIVSTFELKKNKPFRYDITSFKDHDLKKDIIIFFSVDNNLQYDFEYKIKHDQKCYIHINNDNITLYNTPDKIFNLREQTSKQIFSFN